jgi:hypothetical protein
VRILRKPVTIPELIAALEEARQETV